MRSSAIGICLMVLTVTGCGVTPEKFSAPIDVSGKVSMPDGQPAKFVTLRLLPMGANRPAMLETDEKGSFSGKVIPGDYSYVIDEKPPAGKKDSSFAKIAPVNLQATSERKITVAEGQAIDIKLQ